MEVQMHIQRVDYMLLNQTGGWNSNLASTFHQSWIIVSDAAEQGQEQVYRIAVWTSPNCLD